MSVIRIAPQGIAGVAATPYLMKPVDVSPCLVGFA